MKNNIIPIKKNNSMKALSTMTNNINGFMKSINPVEIKSIEIEVRVSLKNGETRKIVQRPFKNGSVHVRLK